MLAGGRKIAGILLESETGEGDATACWSLGVGVNLVSAPPGTPSSRRPRSPAGLEPAPRRAVLDAFARHFHGWARRWREERIAPVREAWQQRRLGWANRSGSASRQHLHGRFLDIDQHGALLLNRGRGAADLGRRRLPGNREEAAMLLAINAGNTNTVFAV